MWKNIVEPGRRQMTIRRMRISRWIPNATNTLRLCNTQCNNGCINAPQRYVIRKFPASLLYEFYSSDIFCVTYGLQLTSGFANGVPVVWLWWLSSCCAIIILYKQNSYFISIVKLYVSILYTNHHQTPYKTLRINCILCHTLRWDFIIHI
jgi:hypothetical protein